MDTNNSNRFIAAFNEIEKFLKKTGNFNQYTSFYMMLFTI